MCIGPKEFLGFSVVYVSGMASLHQPDHPDAIRTPTAMISHDERGEAEMGGEGVQLPWESGAGSSGRKGRCRARSRWWEIEDEGCSERKGCRAQRGWLGCPGREGGRAVRFASSPPAGLPPRVASSSGPTPRSVPLLRIGRARGPPRLRVYTYRVLVRVCVPQPKKDIWYTYRYPGTEGKVCKK